jgi:hypothetical protein
VLTATASCGDAKGSGTGGAGPDGGGGAVSSSSSSSSGTGLDLDAGGGDGAPPCAAYKGTCAEQKLECGSALDGCGNILDCGTCAAGQICGGGGTTNVCAAPPCTAATCVSQGFDCGMATDGCGNVIDCGACAAGLVCGIGGQGNVCGSPPCTNLCLQQTMCAGNATTSVSGVVYAPNGTDPLYNVLVYVPNAPVEPFVDGVAVPHCGCGADVSGSPLVSTATGVDGSFTLTNVPVGANIPLVIQNGRWRRQFVIPSVAACVDTALPTTGSGQIRMPQTHLEGDIPHMGFVTGAADRLECVLRKIGIADTEFSDPSGSGRVHFYVGDTGPGTPYSATTPIEDSLWGSLATLEPYDMVYLACQGSPKQQSSAAQATLLAYTDLGGRVFATHYEYTWLSARAPFDTTAVWAPDANGSQFFANDPGTGLINTTFPRGLALAQWLQGLGASTALGKIQIRDLRDDFTAVVAPSVLWLSVDDTPSGTFPGLGNVPLHYTFDTPVGAPPGNQCGRVLFSDFHVESATIVGAPGTMFPAECTSPAMTPQEQMLEFMIFDLGSCVAPPACVPRTCAELHTTCGPVGDGCGHIIQCGNCPSGMGCIKGACSDGGCTPKTCAEQALACGAQGDGCGNLIMCGQCASGESCFHGACGSGACTPESCAQLGVGCGMTGDGCGNAQSCGTCAAGAICGGGATPVANQCGTPTCIPSTCTAQGFNCGSATDGCGNLLDCGACSGNQVCGGGGLPNVCGGGAG